MADTLTDLIDRLSGAPSIEDLEDGVALLKRYEFTSVSASLFKLADLVRARLAADDCLAAEVREILRKREDE
jgi:hypothetical protein